MADDLSTDAAPQAPTSSRRNATIIIGAGLLVGTLGGLYFVSPRETGATSTAAADSAHKANDSADAAPMTVHMIENLVVNPAQTGGTRFLMLAIAVEVKNGEVEAALKARDSEVRDALLRLLSEKTVQDLTDIARRDSLKDQLRNAIASKFAPGQVGQLYFPQFVIQ